MTPAAVHIWRIPLPPDAPPQQELDAVLTPAEMARADCFHFPTDRARWVQTRAAVRAVLGRELGCPPQQVPFALGPHGKPTLPPGFRAAPLHFNWSHTPGLGLLAVSRDAAVGIDAEQVRADFDPLALAPSVFSPNELACLQSAAPANRHALFFRFWTGKEALLKALGIGLSRPPATVCLAALSQGNAAHAQGVSVFTIPIGSGYAAAIAACAENFSIFMRDWHD